MPIPDEHVSIFGQRGSTAEQHPELATDDVSHLLEDELVGDGGVVASPDPAVAVVHEEVEKLFPVGDYNILICKLFFFLLEITSRNFLLATYLPSE